MIVFCFFLFEFNVRFIVFLKMFSDSIWKKEKSYLEQEASNISILKKEITKETEIDANVQLSITEKIDNLKHSATHLAKKLEHEKHKNGQLDTIIKHIRGQMEQEKVTEASFRNNINSENLNSLQNKFKKLEYDLGQVNGKVNRMSENLEQKKNKISQNRTQRVIDSGIFRNIEKELIDSELTFKKLLIEKIKYQKEYEKIYQEYGSLKEKATTYNLRNDTSRNKTHKELNQPRQEMLLPTQTYQKKFLQVEVRHNNSRFTSQLKVDQEFNRQQQRKVIRIKKMLVQTNVSNCSDLLHFYQNIDAINDKYFNEINIYTDQSNQIEKYLNQVKNSKKDKRNRFVEQKYVLTKQQLSALESKDKKVKNQQLKTELDQEVKQLTELCESDPFKQLLQNLNIQHRSFAEDSYFNFDLLKQTLQLVDLSVSPLLHPPAPKQEVVSSGPRLGSQKLEEIISKVRKNDEHYKVMKKQQFKDEYHKLMKNVGQKTVAGRSMNKKKSFPNIKK